MASPPESPLSSHASSEFGDDMHLDSDDEEHEDTHLMPPSKRQRTGASPFHSTSTLIEEEYISSDSDGDMPDMGTQQAATRDDDDHGEQVTICRWRACEIGDLPNMDALVNHIHEDHIGQRQKKYACEWDKCARIDASHASGYALKAHMRSHTREKPFYCALPGKHFLIYSFNSRSLTPTECDKSFTRSDALAKHMRTVHETEALRPL
jgi:hypothetical protein